jgi:hypothetical protein
MVPSTVRQPLASESLHPEHGPHSLLVRTRSTVLPRVATRLRRLKASDVWLILVLIVAVVVLFTLSVEPGRMWH